MMQGINSIRLADTILSSFVQIEYDVCIIKYRLSKVSDWYRNNDLLQ
jgi:hypothetical protein